MTNQDNQLNRIEELLTELLEIQRASTSEAVLERVGRNRDEREKLEQEELNREITPLDLKTLGGLGNWMTEPDPYVAVSWGWREEPTTFTVCSANDELIERFSFHHATMGSWLGIAEKCMTEYGKDIIFYCDGSQPHKNSRLKDTGAHVVPITPKK